MSSRHADENRWTIYVEGHMVKGLSVMPVAEYEALEQAARAVVDLDWVASPNGAAALERLRSALKAGSFEAGRVSSEPARKENQ